MFDEYKELANLILIGLILYMSIALILFQYIQRAKNKRSIINKILAQDTKLSINDAKELLNLHDNSMSIKINGSKKNIENIENVENTYNNYQTSSEKEMFQCNLFRILLIFTLAIFTILILSLDDKFLVSDNSLTAIINRTLIVLPFLVLILFEAREASRHRKSAVINRQKYLDFNAMQEFIKGLPEKEQISIKKSLLKHFFNHKEFDYKCKDELISKELLETIKSLNNTCSIEIKNAKKSTKKE